MKTVDIKKMDFSRMSRCKKAIEEGLPRELAPIIRMDTDPYVPDRTNSLAGSAFVNEAALQEGKIVYGNTANNATGKPVNNYARRQHDGLPNKSTARHPKATAHWTVVSYRDHKDKWNKAAVALSAKLAKGTK